MKEKIDLLKPASSWRPRPPHGRETGLSCVGIMNSLCFWPGSGSWLWPQWRAQPTRSPHPGPLPSGVFPGTRHTCPTPRRPHLLASRDTICISVPEPLITCKGNRRPLMPGLWGEPCPRSVVEESASYLKQTEMGLSGLGQGWGLGAPPPPGTHPPIQTSAQRETSLEIPMW